MHDGTNRDRIVTILIGNHHGLLCYSADAHDGGVRLVDDGQTENSAELAGVGDGESGTFDIFGLELLGAGAFAQIGNAALQAEEVQVSCVLDDWNDQAPVKSDRDAHVDLAMIANIVAFD